MTQEQLLQDMHLIHAALKLIEEGSSPDQTATQPEEPKAPALSIKQAFKKDEILCMVCGKGGFKTLKKYLATAHHSRSIQEAVWSQESSEACSKELLRSTKAISRS